MLSARSLLLLSLGLSLGACGSGSSSSPYAPTEERVSTSASISFEPLAHLIKLGTRAADGKSASNPLCQISLQDVADELPYELKSQDSLGIGDSLYSYKRALSQAQTLSGVDSRIFSVWTTAPKTIDSTTLTLELSVEPQTLSFTLICSQ